MSVCDFQVHIDEWLCFINYISLWLCRASLLYVVFSEAILTTDHPSWLGYLLKLVNQYSDSLVTAWWQLVSLWVLQEILGDGGRAAIQTQGSVSNPFGPTFVYGYRNIALEVSTWFFKALLFSPIIRLCRKWLVGHCSCWHKLKTCRPVSTM